MKVRALLAVAIVACLALCLPRSAHSAAAAAPDGKTVFLQHCSSCHAVTGLGNGPYPPLAGNADVTSSDTTGLISIVLHGRIGPIQINGSTYSGAMPAWRAHLTNAEIAAVITYVRSAWSNHAPSVSEDQIAAAVEPTALNGADLFALKCASCHQAAGQGTAAYPPLAGNPDVKAADPTNMIAIIVNGRSGPLTVGGKTYTGMMPTWKGQISNADVAVIATYVRSAWGNAATGVTESQIANAGPAVSTAIGRAIYAKRCTSCHAANGQGGGGGAFPALANNPHVNAANPVPILTTIEHGKNVMPSWKGQLSPAEIAAVATYIRSTWGNKANPVSESDVLTIK
ncbi:MAG: c-type cytochrome [Candidatus Velthaea sp.]